MRKVIICLFYLTGISVSFGQGIPCGVEFRVNTYSDNSQLSPQIAALANGGFVVCWESYMQDGSELGIYGQLFSAEGTKISREFQVNSYTWGMQSSPQIASLPNGCFVVCWGSSDDEYSSGGIYGQLFSAEGTMLGKEFRVNTYTKNTQRNPQIATLLNGSFAVCWESYEQDGSELGIYGQLFSAEGTKTGGEFQINTYTDSDQESAHIAALSNGGFVLCWSSERQDGSEYGVYGQMFSSTGIRTGQEFRVNTYTNDFQQINQITKLSNGSFVVFWSSNGQDGSGSGIFGQMFSELWTRIGQEFRVNTYKDNDQDSPQIVALSNGGFVACWDSNNQDGSGWGVYGQIFSSEGMKAGPEFRVNTYTDDWQQASRIVRLSNDGFVVCWHSFGQDGSYGGIYGQLFSADGTMMGQEFRINTHTNNNQYYPRMATLLNGGFVICWESFEQDGSDNGVYAKRFPESPLRHNIEPFNLLEPSNDNSVNIVNPSLVWQQASNETVCYSWELHYRILVDDNPDFLSPQIIEQDQDTTTALHGLKPGTTYFWKVLVKNIACDSLWSSNTNAFFVAHDAVSGVEEEYVKRPEGFKFHQNYPNPFNPETSIRFDLPESGFVVIAVYDINGRLIRMLLNESRTAGSYSVKWDGRDSAGNLVPSGIYVCRMEVRSIDGRRFSQSVKMGLVR